MSLRIIAGERRGTALQTPQGLDTRPTLSRIRESLVMILMPRLAGARVLDLFAGCGALGLEALSRGTTHVTFVENARAARTALAANIDKLGWRGRTAVAPADALDWLRRTPAPDAPPYDLILLDPPYGQGMADRAMEAIGEAAGRWLASDGIVIAQAGVKDPLAAAYGSLAAYRTALYAKTKLVFFTPAAQDALKPTDKEIER
jgi:16S rRNA (guanine966-N2)-methyltransferase